MAIDPARFEVVKNALSSAAEEMKIVLAKTAYSPVLKASGDYSCGIFDRSGNMVAQGPDLPIHLGSMPDAVRSIVETFADAAADDVFIHNDPYRGGSHLPDVNVVVPAFVDGRLLGFGCVRAHWADIGSATPGSYGAVTEIYGEGLRIPPVRLFRNGEMDPGISALIFANVRQPSERLGDLRAQIAANRRAVARLTALSDRYGTDELLGIMAAILDYSETMMRAALRALPDGDATFCEALDGDGVIAPGDTEDRTFTIRSTIHKRGDSDHRRLRRHRPVRRRADERAADGDGVRRVRRAQDDRRPARPYPAQLRLLARGDHPRARSQRGKRPRTGARGLRQPRDLPACRRYRAGRHAPDRPRHARSPGRRAPAAW